MLQLARGFSRQHGIIHFACLGSASVLRRVWCGFACTTPYNLARGQPSPRLDCPPASPHRLPTTGSGRGLGRPLRRGSGLGRLASPGSAWARKHRYGNINPLSIDYACRPRLRSRLTQGGLAWPWNPWSFGGRVSHPPLATHACILTRVASTAGFPRRFPRDTTLPYPSARLDPETDLRAEQCANATTSAVCLSPVTLSARNHLTSELLRTLSRVAASKPTSWLSLQFHILFHLAHA